MTERRSERYWWLAERGRVAAIIWAHLRAQSNWRARFLRRRAALEFIFSRESYLGGGVAGRYAGDVGSERWLRDVGLEWMAESPASLNAYKSRILRVGGRLLSELPALEASPYNGGYEITTRSKLYTDALNGTFNIPANKKSIAKMGWTGLKLGFGAARPVVSAGRLVYEKVPYQRLWWDPADAEDGDPQSFHYAHRVSRSRILAKVRAWDDLEDREQIISTIEQMPEADQTGPQDIGCQSETPYQHLIQSAGMANDADQLWLVHSWHLPGGPGADDGRYVITIHGAPGSPDGRETEGVLWDGGWKRQTFPIVWWSPIPHEDGIDGEGLGHILEPFQRQIDQGWDALTEGWELLGRTKIIYHAGTVAGEALKKTVVHEGVTFIPALPGMLRPDQPYIVIPPAPMSPQQLQWLEILKNEMNDQIGLTSSGSSGGSRLGANASGVALMEEDARQDDVLAPYETEWEHALMRLGEETINAFADAAETDSDLTWRWLSMSDGRPRSAPWSEFSDDVDQLAIAMEPVGVLGKRKSGRLQRILELGQRGAIPADLVTQELNRSADVQRISEIANSGPDLVEWQIAGLSNLKNDAALYYPDENTPHEIGAARGEAAVRQVMRMGAESEEAKAQIIDRLVAYTAACNEAVAAKIPPAPPAMPGMAPGMEALTGASPPIDPTLPQGM